MRQYRDASRLVPCGDCRRGFGRQCSACRDAVLGDCVALLVCGVGVLPVWTDGQAEWQRASGDVGGRPGRECSGRGHVEFVDDRCQKAGYIDAPAVGADDDAGDVRRTDARRGLGSEYASGSHIELRHSADARGVDTLSVRTDRDLYERPRPGRSSLATSRSGLRLPQRCTRRSCRWRNLWRRRWFRLD